MHDVIDQTKLQALRDLMGDSFAMLIDTFITDTSTTLTTLRSELAANNVQEIHRLAHSLKSSSANLGANSLSDIAKQLELEAKNTDLSHAEDHITRLDALFTEVQAVLTQ